MRLRSIWSCSFALSLAVACESKSTSTEAPGSGSPEIEGKSEVPKAGGVRGAADLKGSVTTAGLANSPPVKKPVDKRPLPKLEKDQGGASGKPVRGIGFGGLGVDTPTDIALATTGELYITGYFDGELDAGPAGKFRAMEPPANADKKKMKPTSDAYLAKLDAEGKIAWMQTWGARRDDVARGVAVSGDTIVVVGNFLDELKIGKGEQQADRAANSDDLYAAAFDKNGNSLWVYTAGGLDSDGANAVAAAPDGGWYIAGSFMRTVIFEANGAEYKSKGGTDAFLAKLGKGGELEWVKQFGGNYNDTILHVAVDAQGSVYVQGHFMDKADWGAGAPLVAAGGKDNDVVLAKFDSNGDHVWSKRFGNQFDDVAGGLTVDPAGNVTMTGSFDKSISFGDGDTHVSNGEADMYIARFDGTGKLEWAKTYGADRADIGWGIAADAAGNTVMTGWFENTVDFGKTTLGKVTSNGNKDVFAIKHDINGAVIWVQTWGDKDHDQGRAVVIDPKGDALIAGIYRFTMSFVNPPLESVRAADDRIPKPDVFVVRLQR